jgi:plasmid stabilization system protein ParE
MRLRYTLPALADLASILEYIADHSPQGAARVHARIRAITDLLLRYPLAGAMTDDPTIRRITRRLIHISSSTRRPMRKSSSTRCATARAILPIKCDQSESSPNRRRHPAISNPGGGELDTAS